MLKISLFHFTQTISSRKLSFLLSLTLTARWSEATTRLVARRYLEAQEVWLKVEKKMDENWSKY